MKKKVLISIIGIILSLCISINILSVYALSNDNVSMLFKEFITECFEDENNVIVFDGKQDISKEFLNLYHDSFINDDLSTINTAVLKNNYQITHVIETPVTKVSNIKSQTFKSYESGYDSGNKYFKEWMTILYCKFSYNPDTGKITNIYDPVLDIDFGSWGSNFSPRYYNVSTSKQQMSSLSVKYSCSYKVEADFQIHDYLPKLKLDYGSCGRSYTLKA
ncbi:hypothetical protein [Thomasclavelia cocleata]|uniref:hypothetical protein n=1 Tax=Thomasclavelia cocleata TaxID=69824 RepID=UPI00242CB887|nr:hypothetical protein [Thomasclavelia cocleata]